MYNTLLRAFCQEMKLARGYSSCLAATSSYAQAVTSHDAVCARQSAAGEPLAVHVYVAFLELISALARSHRARIYPIAYAVLA
jgi:hypothetical protein